MSVSSHQEHDDAVHTEHQAALARGEQRVLYLTKDGMLHSYTKTELGGPPNGSTRWWQNLPGLLVLLTVLGLTTFVIITDPGTATQLGATICAAVLFALGAAYLIWESVVVYRARKARLRRGSPDPLKIMSAKTKLPESYTQSQPIRKSRWNRP
ncbi:hypothetical protein OVA06_12870 [Pseudarthrobacter sp. SL88]|uniref:hypothetical protein n=1 Tax=Pseudarthrobacter sp. SL88 TaxID=2994666 RepID=UPI00227346B0|nr:hypothetical protein [Pseudarthrobacter sp. SL88]MCY1675587.1 hypothetical protein [Pseudarthrobacter sp. SL88]